MRIYHLDKWTCLKVKRVSIIKLQIEIWFRVSLAVEYSMMWDFEITFSKMKMIMNKMLRERIEK